MTGSSGGSQDYSYEGERISVRSYLETGSGRNWLGVMDFKHTLTYGGALLQCVLQNLYIKDLRCWALQISLLIFNWLVGLNILLTAPKYFALMNSKITTFIECIIKHSSLLDCKMYNNMMVTSLLYIIVFIFHVYCLKQLESLFTFMKNLSCTRAVF